MSFLWQFVLFLGTFHFVFNSCLKLCLILERFLKILKNDWGSNVVFKSFEIFWGGMTGGEMTGNRQSLRYYENEGIMSGVLYG